MKNAAAYYIDKVVENDAQVGLVTFSNNGFILNQLLFMNNQSNRNQIVNNIKNLGVIGYTNIPDGLRKGIQVLGGSMEDNVTMFGTIFLLTDGANNVESDIWDNNFVINRIISKGLVVNTIGYGINADPKLTMFAEKSGGKFFNADTNGVFVTLMDKFAYKASCESQNNSLVKILDGTTNAEITSGDSEIILLYVDAYVGKDMLITITINITVSNYIISLLNAFNDEYFNTSSVNQTAGFTLSFNVLGYVKIGYYRLKFKSLIRIVKRATFPVSIKYGVSAVLNQNLTKVINPSGKLNQSEVQLVDSFTLVSAMVDLSTSGLENRDNVSVTLSVAYPSNGKLERQMFDNGLGCDSLAGDQIYATCLYAKDLTSVGYYTITGTVEIILYNTVEKIKRTVDLGTFRVVGISANIQDKIPPAKIDSVTLSIANETNRDLKLDFQSTGDDGVIGNISFYKIKIVGQNETIVSTYQPGPPLVPVSLVVNLNKETSNLSFKVSVKGVDPSGNEGEWSPEQFFSWNYNQFINNSSSLITSPPKSTSSQTIFSLANIIIILFFIIFINLFYKHD